MHDASGAVAAVLGALSEKFANCRVDILVHNASHASLDTLAAVSEPELWRAAAANFVFPILLTQALLPFFSTSGTGRIVNVSSEATHAARPRSTVYSATKACMESWSRTWAAELGQAYHGLTVNAVAPGMMETDLWRALPAERRAMWLERFQATPAAPRIGQADDVASVVAWLCSDAAKWVTGATIPVNGGFTAFC